MIRFEIFIFVESVIWRIRTLGTFRAKSRFWEPSSEMTCRWTSRLFQSNQLLLSRSSYSSKLMNRMSSGLRHDGCNGIFQRQLAGTRSVHLSSRIKEEAKKRTTGSTHRKRTWSGLYTGWDDADFLLCDREGSDLMAGFGCRWRGWLWIGVLLCHWKSTGTSAAWHQVVHCSGFYWRLDVGIEARGCDFKV